MSQGNGAQKGDIDNIVENAEGKSPLELVQEQHKTDQQNLAIAREQVSAEQHNHEVDEVRIDADEEVPGRTQPSDIRHHPQRIKF